MKAETRNKLRKFFQRFEPVMYRRGEVIIHPTEVNKGIFFIDDGFAKIYTVNDAGVESGAYFFKSLFYLTIMQQMTGVKNKFFFEAITPSTIYIAPEGEVVQFLRQNPEIKEEVVVDMMRCFIDLLEESTTMMASGAKNKVAWLIMSINGRLERENLSKEEAGFEYTHQLIASLTGLTRETVTLQLLELKKEGLIENKHKMVKILDRKGLEKVAMGAE